MPQVPERPELAPGVELRGQMTDSAFVDPPWLIERGEQYLHVSELLYRVAEQADGRRTVAQLAEAVSAAGRTLSPEHAAEVVSQLVALRIVSPAGEPAVVPAEEDAPVGTVHLKRVVLSPQMIAPIVEALQVLFRPPILVIMLAVAAVAEVWVYRGHGVTASMRAALLKPELMLWVLALVVIGTLFHELGHAAALKYGGGRVGAIGVGIYLVYPVFYTDVTDNYRLPRRARVRTDLGGIYFTLLFITALVVAYYFTRADVLLLTVVLLNLQTVYNLVPFVRFDGYWTASDLTGVPDFFTYVGPFVRSFLPARFAGDRQMPALKPWAKVFFAAWLLVAIPLLVTLLFHVLASFPAAVEAASDAVKRQFAALSSARGRGDVVLLLATVLRIAALALPVAGVTYILFQLVRLAGGLLWRWSQPTPLRRTVGTLVGAAAVLALASLWAPHLPLTGGQSGPLYRSLRAGLAGATPVASPTPDPADRLPSSR